MGQKELNIFEITEFSFGRKFGLLGRLYHAELSRSLSYLGIERHFSVLVLLDKVGEKCCQKFLSDTLHIDKTMMVGVIDTLVKKGFIKRSQNPEDRREYWIQLTPKAKKHMPEVKAVVNRLNRSVMKGMTQAEIKQFHKHLQLIYNNVKHLSQS